MKATPIIVNWHDANSPVYSAHFEPDSRTSKGRLATGGGDNNVRIWKLHKVGEDRSVEYLATLAKHTQAVNVVRWSPRSEMLASAGDDGNVILWVPSEVAVMGLGQSEYANDKESWRPKHMCRSAGAEIYDLAWSPDGQHFVIGSMDNVARIYNASTGALVRQIAEHSHYVQGVAWDPLNEYIATQSSDRSVHVYSLRHKNGAYALDNNEEKPYRVASHMRADLPGRRHTPGSFGAGEAAPRGPGPADLALGSPASSMPGTPPARLPMYPPTSTLSQSRRSSFSSRRSVSPAPSLPLPAVMPMEASPKPLSAFMSSGAKNSNIYANETLTSFFRRLAFTNDGSLLLTPAGQYQVQVTAEGGKPTLETVNTVFIYTRGGINRPPIAHLPGHKKPSIAVKCAPFKYALRQSTLATKHMTIDTSSSTVNTHLPDAVGKPTSSSMDHPPLVRHISSIESPAHSGVDSPAATPGPAPTFALPYRMVYAVATQDSVLVYDTQQATPICVVSNLHLATFTDLTWSPDGSTLFITSSDGFCSLLTFSDGELGQRYQEPPMPAPLTPSGHGTPVSTPGAGSFVHPASGTTGPAEPHHRHHFQHHAQRNLSASGFAIPSPSTTVPSMTAGSTMTGARPASSVRSNSESSVVTTHSLVMPIPTGIMNATLIAGTVPALTAASSPSAAEMHITTPPGTPYEPMTIAAPLQLHPQRVVVAASSDTLTTGLKREATCDGDGETEPSHGEGDGDVEVKKEEQQHQQVKKKRRVAPTLVSVGFLTSTPAEQPKPATLNDNADTVTTAEASTE